nr:MAG TPA: hypothetical protein [Caudoviricetes sp.]
MGRLNWKISWRNKGQDLSVKEKWKENGLTH